MNGIRSGYPNMKKVHYFQEWAVSYGVHQAANRRNYDIRNLDRYEWEIRSMPGPIEEEAVDVQMLEIGEKWKGRT